MFRNYNQSWIPIFACILLSGIGLFICLCLVLSLIPVYLNNRSVEKSNTIYPVYALNNVAFKIGNDRARRIRTTRDADETSYEPTSAMISSVAGGLSNLFNKADGRVVVTELTMSSTTTLVITIKIYFLDGSITSQRADKIKIEEILKEGLTLSIYIEYYQNCSFNVTVLGTIVTTLDGNINENEISGPIKTRVETLVQVSDVCGNNRTAPLVYPTDCNETKPSGIVTTISMNGESEGYQDYCYYFLTSTSETSITVQFIFSSNSDDKIYIDDIKLTSTVNLIINGDFQTVYEIQEPKKPDNFRKGQEQDWGPGPAWTLSTCEESCNAETRSGKGKLDTIGFRAQGNRIILGQTVAINTIGQEFVYTLRFSIRSRCNNQPCSVVVILTTT